jgi:hypothetical protein
MATNPKDMFRGAASVSSATLYTVPASTTAIVTDILVVNDSGAAATFELLLDDVRVTPASTPIGLTGIVNFAIKQVLTTGKTIKGLASSTGVKFHISGVEVV